MNIGNRFEKNGIKYIITKVEQTDNTGTIIIIAQPEKDISSAIAQSIRAEVNEEVNSISWGPENFPTVEDLSKRMKQFADYIRAMDKS